jgi:hypothetical protein
MKKATYYGLNGGTFEVEYDDVNVFGGVGRVLFFVRERLER